jgi:hypothetical protein
MLATNFMPKIYEMRGALASDSPGFNFVIKKIIYIAYITIKNIRSSYGD